MKFNNVEDATETLRKELFSKNWKDAFLKNQDGELNDFFVEKDMAKQMNDIIPFGYFYSREQMYELLHSSINVNISEIAKWLVKGNNLPIKLPIAFCSCIGCSFDENGEEHQEKKIQIIIRRDRKNNTKYGFFVSSFHPVYKIDN